MASAPITASLMETNSLDIHPTSPQPRQFDLKIVRDSFVNCIQSDEQLLLREYVRAYEELCM